jgi:hypothetical protein
MIRGLPSADDYVAEEHFPNKVLADYAFSHEEKPSGQSQPQLRLDQFKIVHEAGEQVDILGLQVHNTRVIGKLTDGMRKGLSSRNITLEPLGWSIHVRLCSLCHS